MSGPGAAPRPVRRAAITNLGCKVNQSEMDAVERLLRARGVEIVEDGAAADLHLVNTCTVTSTADHKSRKAVRGARRANPDAQVFVTGCSVQISPELFAAADPAARLVDNRSKDSLLAEVERLLGAPADAEAPHGPLDAALPTLAGVEIEGIVDDRTRIDRTRAFIKVQDGCSFHCTYCIIPRARGDERSLTAGSGARGRPARPCRRTSRDRPDRDQHRHLRRRLVGARLPRLAHGVGADPLRPRPPDPRRDAGRADPPLLDRAAARRRRPPRGVDGGGRRAAASRTSTSPSSRATTASSGGWGAATTRPSTRTWSRGFARGVPGAAIHADLVTGFPTEDDAAFERSLAFIRQARVRRAPRLPLLGAARDAGDPDGRPGHRAAQEANAPPSSSQRPPSAGPGWRAAAVGTERRILFEDESPDGGWIGHAEDHLLVRVPGDSRGWRWKTSSAWSPSTAVDPADPSGSRGRSSSRTLRWPGRSGCSIRPFRPPPFRPPAPEAAHDRSLPVLQDCRRGDPGDARLPGRPPGRHPRHRPEGAPPPPPSPACPHRVGRGDR